MLILNQYFVGKIFIYIITFFVLFAETKTGRQLSIKRRIGKKYFFRQMIYSILLLITGMAVYIARAFIAGDVSIVLFGIQSILATSYEVVVISLWIQCGMMYFERPIYSAIPISIWIINQLFEFIPCLFLIVAFMAMGRYMIGAQRE